MKAKELKDKSVEELNELERITRGELFQARLQNYTNRLDDTSSIPKRRRDLARIANELRTRELEVLTTNVQRALSEEAG